MATQWHKNDLLVDVTFKYSPKLNINEEQQFKIKY